MSKPFVTQQLSRPVTTTMASQYIYVQVLAVTAQLQSVGNWETKTVRRMLVIPAVYTWWTAQMAACNINHMTNYIHIATLVISTKIKRQKIFKSKTCILYSCILWDWNTPHLGFAVLKNANFNGHHHKRSGLKPGPARPEKTRPDRPKKRPGRSRPRVITDTA